MKINELLREKDAILNEAASLQSLLNTFKIGSEIAERKIKQLESKVTISEEEQKNNKTFLKKRIARISQDYIDYVK